MAVTAGGAFQLFYGFGAWPIIEFAYRFQRPQGGFVWRAHVGTTGLGLGAGWAF